MNRLGVSSRLDGDAVPRRRGDEPVIDRFVTEYLFCSPQARG